MFNQAIKAHVVLLALLAVACVHTTAYGQREGRDRPDSVGSRSIGGRDGAQSRRDRQPEDPEAKVEEQLRKTARTPNTAGLRAAGGGREALTAAGVADENNYAKAYAEARLAYEAEFPKEDKSKYATIGLEDFARAYIIALHPVVKRKYGGYQLALLRAMTTTYDGYEEILREKVPELGEETAEKLEDEAKKVVKALSSKKP